MAFCLGPFCGRFRDELGGSSSDEDDEDGMTGPGQKVKRPKRRRQKAKANAAEASAALKWAPFIIPVRKAVVIGGVEKFEEVQKLKSVNNSNITINMLNRINQLSQVEQIELIKCGLDAIPMSLDELDGLSVLCLSQNSIRKFDADLGGCASLEQLILANNHISNISPGIFSELTFSSLEVISLSRNRLAHLPNDFGRTNRNLLKYIDLSHNQLQSIPETIVKCRLLQELNLSHNSLKELPESYDLRRLQKLKVSFNELTKLPTQIGRSTGLQKLRINSNKIRELPASILVLWDCPAQGHRGSLSEFLVDRNPLVMPSLTAFQMVQGRGGVDRAFSLLKEHLEEEKKRLAAKSTALEVAVIEDTDQAALPAPEEANLIRRSRAKFDLESDGDEMLPILSEY
ncbi:unnamed protein product, partial [Polarella glacialis]